MSKPTFVYVTYIGNRPEKVWQALTDGEFTKQYWGNRRNASDWKVGSPWRHEDFDDAKSCGHRRHGGRELAAAAARD